MASTAPVWREPNVLKQVSSIKYGNAHYTSMDQQYANIEIMSVADWGHLIV